MNARFKRNARQLTTPGRAPGPLTPFRRERPRRAPRSIVLKLPLIGLTMLGTAVHLSSASPGIRGASLAGVRFRQRFTVSTYSAGEASHSRRLPISVWETEEWEKELIPIRRQTRSLNLAQ